MSRAGLLCTTFALSCIAEPAPEEVGREASASRIAVTWSSGTNVTPSGNDLVKSGGGTAWDAGSTSIERIVSDGYLEFTTAENTTVKAVGLSNRDDGLSLEDIDLAIRLGGDGRITIWEAGIRRSGDFGTYVAGDLFRIQVRQAVVTYWKNGARLYTSSARANFPLQVDAALRTPGATIHDAVLEDALFWARPVNAAASGNDLTKTAGGRAWDAGAVSIASLDGDGYAEFTTGESTTAKMVGLSNQSDGQSYEEIDFAVFLRADGTIAVRENGVVRGQDLASYQAGDVVRIAVAGGVVTYALNGTVFYTSSQAPTFPLHVDTSLRTAGATVQDVQLISTAAIVLFDNSSGAFEWLWWCDCIGEVTGNWLDMRRTPANQPAVGSDVTLHYFKVDPAIGNITPGGIWFLSDGSVAAGDPFVLEGDWEDEEWDDIRVTPPADKEVGSVVGPNDSWVGFNEFGVQTGHFQDESGDTAPSQVWFQSGLVAARFVAADGVHFGFVEVAWDQPGSLFQARYIPVRWGYNPRPGVGFVIPPSE